MKVCNVFQLLDKQLEARIMIEGGISIGSFPLKVEDNWGDLNVRTIAQNPKNPNSLIIVIHCIDNPKYVEELFRECGRWLQLAYEEHAS